MQLWAPRRTVFAGILLFLLLLTSPLRAAAPPGPPDQRRAWLYNQGSFRRIGPGRWRHNGLTRKVVYQEHHSSKDFVELFDPDRNRYYRLYSWGLYVFRPAERHYAFLRAGRWVHPSTRPLNHALNADERGKLATTRERNGFPRLGDDYEVLAPASHSYNCIGWSLGNNSSWVWPRSGGEPVTLSDFDSLYAYYGFNRVAKLNFKLMPGRDKIVLYALRRDDGSAEPTHAARQLEDGSWSSKLGSLPLIRHLHPDDVAGPSYGAPWVMYVRKRLIER